MKNDGIIRAFFLPYLKKSFGGEKKIFFMPITSKTLSFAQIANPTLQTSPIYIFTRAKNSLA